MQTEARGANQAAKEACGRGKKPAGRDWGWGGRSLKVSQSAVGAEERRPEQPPPAICKLKHGVQTRQQRKPVGGARNQRAETGGGEGGR